jgi:hypothetical protein
LNTLHEFHGIRVYCIPAEGPVLRSGKDAVDVMSAASEHRAAFIAIPLERLGDDFFELRTGVAGEIAQKFVVYGARVAIVGDIADKVAASKSLAAFVAESNRGNDLWFVENLEKLELRLIGIK